MLISQGFTLITVLGQLLLPNYIEIMLTNSSYKRSRVTTHLLSDPTNEPLIVNVKWQAT